MFYNTGEICLIEIGDNDKSKFIDMGNYYKTERGDKVLITTNDMARKYGHLITVPIYEFNR